MSYVKRSLLLVLGLAAAGVAWGNDVYPTKAVKILVGFAPGGATDLLARIYATKLSAKFDKSFIVENRPGAGGNTAIQALTQSAPDGYTIAMGANYIAANAAFNRNAYDWDRELAPIALIAYTPNVLVVPANSKFQNVNDIIQQAKKPNSHLTFASAGMGSSIHLAGELFKMMAGVNMVHVPYKGVSPAEVDLMAGTVDMMFGSISTAIPLINAKKLKILAITGKERIKEYPDVPTLDESGLRGYDVGATFLMVAPAKVPAEILNKLADAVAEISRHPDVVSQVERIYAKPLTGGPAATKTFLKGEFDKWQGLVKATGLKFE